MTKSLTLSLAVSIALSLTAAEGADAGKADRYRFASGSGEEHPVTLSATEAGVRFAWPHATPADWDTAFLGVQGTANSAAESWIEVVASTGVVKQYFKAGTAGHVLVNLTGLKATASEGVSVDLRTHGLTVEPGAATLRLFANHLDWKTPILILAPHPDDAEIAAFGLYAGSNATIVTVTSGNAGDMNYKDDFPDLAEHYLFKGFVRAVDSVTVPLQGGIPPERCFNLGYFDARLPKMHGKPADVIPEMYGPNTDVAPYRRADVSHMLPTGSRTNSWNHLVEDLVAVLRKVNPGIIVMPHPFLDGHQDHEFVAVAAVEALEKWQGSARFLLYTNHADDNVYPYGPAGSTMSLPPWSGLELPIESLFAKTVTPELQRRKLYALESMHDLRLSPTEQNGCLPPGTAAQRPDYPRVTAVDYLRRGPRSEELFFVFGRNGVRDLIHSFVEARKNSNDADE